MIRRLFCRLFGHNDTPLGCRINDGPWILTGVSCRRCYRYESIDGRPLNRSLP